MGSEKLFNFPLYHSVENFGLDEVTYSETAHLAGGMKQRQPYAFNLKSINDDDETESVEPSDFLVSGEGEGEGDFSLGATELHRIAAKPHDRGGTSVEPQSDTFIASGASQFQEENLSNGKKRKRNSEIAPKYAFKTRSESDILEDGYKWRKYGKKSIKNIPHPRNYYRCSDTNCNVKKRVERDAVDEGIVITTYEGRHNHECPSLVYYIEKPSVVISQQSSLDQYPPFYYTSACPEPGFMFMNAS